MTAGALARSAEFFSFGTNDLTQTTWGISRDDAESSFLAEYRRAGLVPDDPGLRLLLPTASPVARLEAGRAAVLTPPSPR